MRIILAGGSGLIGRPLALHLRNHNHQVIILSRNPDKVLPFPADIQIVRWNAQSPKGWGHLVDGCQAVINLAGENLAGRGFFPQRWSRQRKEHIQNSRLSAGQAIVQAIQQVTHKPQVVVQASAVGFYGPRGDEILDEDSPPGNDFLATLCQQWEASTKSVETLGIRHIVIRMGIYLTLEGGALWRLLLPYRFFAGGPMGSGKQWYSWIHRQDALSAIRFLIEHPQASGVYNLTAPTPLTNAEFSRILGRVLSRPSWIPLPRLLLFAAFGEVATVVMDGQRVLPKRLLELGYRFQFPDAESALRDLLT